MSLLVLRYSRCRIECFLIECNRSFISMQRSNAVAHLLSFPTTTSSLFCTCRYVSHLCTVRSSVNATNKHNNDSNLTCVHDSTIAPMTSTQAKANKAIAFGAFSHTRINHFLPPAVGRALVAAGLLLLESFWLAYKREAAKVAEERRDDAQEGRLNETDIDKPLMTPQEAVLILGLDKINPLYTEQHAEIELPLTKPIEIEAARESFKHMRDVALAQNNLFLLGKVSAAYRLCVDLAWDMPRRQIKEEDKEWHEEQEECESRKEANGDSRIEFDLL